MSGLEMYNKLLNVFQGQEDEEDKAVNAAAIFEKLLFTSNTRYSPEVFLSKLNECLKRMEMKKEDGSTLKSCPVALLPSVFHAKIEHP
eukprot:5450357-Ditylum_brightwellii.AAC.1